MFYNCIMEGRALPDYSGADSYQVSLTFKAPILDTAFVIFVRKVQDNRAVAEQLNVFELLALYKIAMRDYEGREKRFKKIVGRKPYRLRKRLLSLVQGVSE